MKNLLIAFLIALTAAPAGAKAKLVKRASKAKLECRTSELRRQDCELRSGNLKIGLFKERFRFDDGKWLATQDLPVAGDEVEWKNVRLTQMGKRTLIEMWVWGVPEGDGQVQPLHWVVLEIGQFEKPVKINQVVQRRKMLPLRNVAAQNSKSKKRKYHYDPLEKHSLKAKKGLINWRAGKETGQF